jgi:hypothetical protein
MRRSITLAVTTVCALCVFATAVQAGSSHHRSVLTLHRAWLVTGIGAHRFALRAAAAVNAYSDRVQPQSACVRRSPLRVDCPFSYVLGFEAAENFERCRDIGRVEETAADRFRFTALKPRCELVNNETP